MRCQNAVAGATGRRFLSFLGAQTISQQIELCEAAGSQTRDTNADGAFRPGADRSGHAA